MNGQNQQQTPPGEPIQAQQFHQDSNIRTPYMARQAYHGPAVSTRDGNIGNLSHLLGALNLPNQHPGSNYNSAKGSLSQAAPSIEIPAFHRAPYNGQYMILPNGTMVGSIPHAAAFPQPHLSGHDPLQYTPANVYPAFVTGTSMIPGNIQGYTWPYSVNPEVSDFNTSRGNSLSSSEENKAPGNPTSDLGIHQNCYTAVAAVDRATLANYAYNMPSLPQAMQPYLQYQMMKSSNGYVLQDLEALTQQDPPIPRAVPAMWTNPSDLTLAKCLENREGITNVYIRGFLPETTDEMLHAYASRFGKIERCKAIIDLETGLCKGSFLRDVPCFHLCSPSSRFGFVQFYNFESCENCIRGFFYLGYQASFAQVRSSHFMTE
jgi:RNA recognition motif. (a.k.a. RRM, RBD, or RNP domain)